MTREIGITETTFYRWKSKYGGLEVSDTSSESPRQTSLEHHLGAEAPALRFWAA